MPEQDTAQLMGRLYKCALANLELAKTTKIVRDANYRVNRSYEILRELHQAINVDEGGELAMNLVKMYEFMEFELLEAMTGKAENFNSHIDRAAAILRPLSEAWESLVVIVAMNTRKT